MTNTNDINRVTYTILIMITSTCNISNVSNCGIDNDDQY